MKRTDSERLAHIFNWQQSGLGRQQYCIENKIGYSTFCKWLQDNNKIVSPVKSKGKFIDLNSSNNINSFTIKFPNGIEIFYNGNLTFDILTQLLNA